MHGPVCAPATPLLPSAVAVVRVTGPDLAARLAGFVALPPPREARLRVLRWEGFREEALVLFFPGPASHTGEDVVELHVHGNPLLVRRLLEHLGRLGIPLAEPGEFTRRALLHGRQDLLGVEALADLMGAATDAQVRQAQARRGVQPAWIREAREVLAPWVARAEAAVDYGEEEGIRLDLEGLKRDVARLSASFHVERARSEAARWLRDGVRVALAGRPNAGKSTLFNALAGEDRAIVTAQPGTTRDVLEARTEWAGLPLLLFDTAGLREARDEAERQGVARAGAVLEGADLILHLVPVGDAAPDALVADRLAPLGEKVLLVRTLGDLPCPTPAGELRVSAATGDLEALAGELRARFLGDRAPEACLGAMATARQRELLGELVLQAELLGALEPSCPPEVPASLLQGAWGLLARLTGEDRAEAALDQVFSSFCLGK